MSLYSLTEKDLQDVMGTFLLEPLVPLAPQNHQPHQSEN